MVSPGCSLVGVERSVMPTIRWPLGLTAPIVPTADLELIALYCSRTALTSVDSLVGCVVIWLFGCELLQPPAMRVLMEKVAASTAGANRCIHERDRLEARREIDNGTEVTVRLITGRAPAFRLRCMMAP
jgi:hypothetical protein